MRNSAYKYYLLALLEGIGVIAVELMGAKIQAPYFGTSLIIWTMVIGITLVALAGSYSLGGWLSRRTLGDEGLFILLGGGAVLLAFMPATGPFLFRLFAGMPLLGAVAMCTTLLLLPPIMLFGATTPLIIQGLTERVEDAGNVSGRVYAMSTTGGIFTTFVIGFWVIPDLGITKPTLLLAALVLLVSNLCLGRLRLPVRAGLSAALVLPALLLLWPRSPGNGEVRVVYEEEGVLGQVKVVDVAAQGEIPTTRKLLFNGIPQTDMIKGDYSATSHFSYVHMLATLSGMKPAGSQALICGLGAGSLTMEYSRLGFKTDVVDIDWRLPGIGERYFYLDPNAFTFYVDDARHYIHETDQVYDIITLDIALSEAQPYHLYTVEAFKEFKEKLKPDGLLITNFQGYLFGPKGVAERSIFKTMQAAGFEVHAVPSLGTGIQDIIFVASPTTVPFERLSVRGLSPCCINVAHADQFVTDARRHVVSNLDLSDALLLEDDRPMLDLIRLPSVMEFRRNKIKSIADLELETDGKLNQ